MVRMMIFAAGALVGGLTVGAAAHAEGGAPPRLAPVQLAGANAPMAAQRSTTGAPLRATLVGRASVPVPACARKVKVIYAGYGEADRASCTLAAAAPGR